MPITAVLAHSGTQDLHFGPLTLRLGSACMENGQFELDRRGTEALGAVPVDGELEQRTEADEDDEADPQKMDTGEVGSLVRLMVRAMFGRNSWFYCI